MKVRSKLIQALEGWRRTHILFDDSLVKARTYEVKAVLTDDGAEYWDVVLKVRGKERGNYRFVFGISKTYEFIQFLCESAYEEAYAR